MKRAFAAGAHAGESVEELTARLRREADASTTRTSRPAGPWARYGAALLPDERARPDPLQRRRAGHRRLRHRAGRDPGARSRPAKRSPSSPTRRGRSCRARGSPPGSWSRDGIDTTVIADNMAGGDDGGRARSNAVVVGADRIAANGDIANKIGTYGLAVLAQEHGIPFYVAAPWSTIDLATPTGAGIPIEERERREVTHLGGIAARARGRVGAQPRLRRHPAPLRHRRSSPSAASRTRPTPRAWPRAGSGVTLLGIETSCDETAAAVVADRRPARHGDPLERRRLAGGDPPPYGGVVPELASRQHVRDICGVVEQAIGDAGATLAVARRGGRDPGPGAGRLAARRRRRSPRRAAWAHGKPLVAVNHIAGHIEAPLLAHGDVAAAGGRAGGLRRAHEPLSRARGRRLPPARPHPRRRGGGGVRQGGEARWAWAIPAGR